MQKKKKHFATSRICKGNYREQKVNECFHVVQETIHKVHANLKLNGKPIKFMIDSGATVNVIPATFVKDNKNGALTKKGKKLDISVYGGKKVRTEGTTYQPCQQKKSDNLSHGCEWEGTTNFKL